MKTLYHGRRATLAAINSTRVLVDSTTGKAVPPQVEKGSRWIGHGAYYAGSIVVDRVHVRGASTWIRFYLDGHGEEEVSIEEFLKYFKPDTSPVLVVDVEGGAQ